MASHPARPGELSGPADQRIVPFATGGPTDAIARIYAEFLSRDLCRWQVRFVPNPEILRTFT
jgi:tripartite-type tricarboxylate transporter receptor subunit TctC